MIYTIGYRILDNVSSLSRLAELTGAPIVDIRFNPFTSKEFNRYRLGDQAKINGWSYYWIKELGNENYRGGNIRIHALHLGLKKMGVLIERHKSIVLMCCCESPLLCHRSTVCRAWLKLNPGEKISHITRPIDWNAPDTRQGQLF